MDRRERRRATPSDAAACDAVQERLTEAFLARKAAGEEDLVHARGCARCASHREGLGALAAALDAFPEPVPRPELIAAARERAAAELATSRPAAPAAPARPERNRPARRRDLPSGFGRELARLLAGSVAPLPVVLLWNVGVFLLAERWLAPLLPGPLPGLLFALYAAALAAWLTCVYGSIPLLAYRRSQRHAER